MLREYVVPTMLALALHAGLGAALLRGWNVEPDDTRTVMPNIVQAKLLVIEKPVRKAAPEKKPAPTPSPPKPAEPPPKPKPVAKAPPKPAVPLPDPDAERRAREEAERQERLRELNEQLTARALAEEEIDAGEANAATMTYVQAITRAIVDEWAIPPSARNDMLARLQVDLTPSGDLLGVQVMDSSGNSAFDRSAEAAVRKAARSLGRFPVPPDRRLFEEQFRHFTILFKPEDLLR